jgi:hypothetical protein
MPADFFLPVGRHHLAVLGVVVATREIEVIESQVDAKLPGCGVKDAQALWNNFLADPVAGEHCDAVGGHLGIP